MPGPPIFERVEGDREQIFPLLYGTLSCQYPQKNDQNQKCLDSYIRKNSDAPLDASELQVVGVAGGGWCRVLLVPQHVQIGRHLLLRLDAHGSQNLQSQQARGQSYGPHGGAPPIVPLPPPLLPTSLTSF